MREVGRVVTVYVDDARIPARVGRISSRWSHLTADTVEELNAFALSIGQKLSWFQTCKRSCAKPGLPCVHWHYDLTDPQRDKAIAAGAVPIGIRDMGALCSARRRGETWTPGGGS